MVYTRLKRRPAHPAVLPRKVPVSTNTSRANSARSSSMNCAGGPIVLIPIQSPYPPGCQKRFRDQEKIAARSREQEIHKNDREQKGSRGGPDRPFCAPSRYQQQIQQDIERSAG